MGCRKLTPGRASRRGLFGDDDDDDDDEPKREASPIDDGLTDEERARRQALEYGEDDNEDMEIIKKHEAIAQVELANFYLPATEKVWHARLPNFLSLQPQAFDDVMWEPEDQEDLPPTQSQDGQDSPSGAATPKGNVPDENVIRWRWAMDSQGTPVRSLTQCRKVERADPEHHKG